MEQNVYTFTEVPTICILTAFLPDGDEIHDIKTLSVQCTSALRGALDINEKDTLFGVEFPLLAKAMVYFETTFYITLDPTSQWFASFL